MSQAHSNCSNEQANGWLSWRQVLCILAQYLLTRLPFQSELFCMVTTRHTALVLNRHPQAVEGATPFVHIHTSLPCIPEPKLRLHQLEATLSTGTYISLPSGERWEAHQQKTAICRCSFSVAYNQKHPVSDKTSAAFSRLWISRKTKY